MGTGKSLLSKITEQENTVQDIEISNPNPNPNNTVRKLTASLNSGSKDKQISAKVNENVYALFSQINKAQGISNNSALNMIISKYVRENSDIIE